jgi:hypothetical protein
MRYANFADYIIFKAIVQEFLNVVFECIVVKLVANDEYIESFPTLGRRYPIEKKNREENNDRYERKIFIPIVFEVLSQTIFGNFIIHLFLLIIFFRSPLKFERAFFLSEFLLLLDGLHRGEEKHVAD